MSVLVLLANMVRGVRFEVTGESAPQIERGTTMTPMGGMPLRVIPLGGKE